MTLPSALVIESIELGDEQAAAELRIGPRREQLVAGFSYPNFWEHRKIPRQLGDEFRAKRAVIEILARAYQGESIALPMDLSAIAFNQDAAAWPMYQDPKDHEADPPVAIEITRVEHDTPALQVSTVHLTVVGVPTVVTVQTDERKLLKFRFLSGAHPWQLSDVEAWAMLMALLRATKA